MIEVGDIIRVKPVWKHVAGVFLVLEKKLNQMTERTMFLCVQGSKKIWLYKERMEKL
tara:strand:+ start:247 stop:417 length:171 start_codon:yes stop_codon:yes gene_type:complete